MARATLPGEAPPATAGSSGSINKTMIWLRWTAIAVLLLLALAAPTDGWTGIPNWTLVLVFAAYNLILDGFARRLPPDDLVGIRAIFDVLVGGAVYALGPEPGGVLFILFFLAIACGSAGLGDRSSVLYILVVGTVAASIDLILFSRISPTGNINHLPSRLTVLSLFGAGITILARRLILEAERARADRHRVERLQELDRLRQEFVATVSHELRTPLTAARAAMGLLTATTAGERPPRERELLETAERNIGHLERLIDDLLAFNQLEARVLELEFALLDLRLVVRGALSTVHPLIRAKEQILEVDVRDVPRVRADRRRLEQVLVNLLANAHYHTPPGSRIVIAAREEDGHVIISVCDNGPGIPQDEIDRVFERFYRLPSGSPGSGLGLTIARGIVALHQGRLWAERVDGEGICFHVALPLSHKTEEREEQ